MKGRVRELARRLPSPVQDLLRRMAGSRRIVLLGRPLRWGTLRRFAPLSERYGLDRGTPVDHAYVEEFFAAHAADVTGRVLEAGSSSFTRRLGKGVTSVDVVDADGRNDGATIVADLADAGCLPAGRFDCILAPQVLQYGQDPAAVLASLWQALAPGGVILVTAPSVARLGRRTLGHHLDEEEAWRFLPRGFAAAVRMACPGAEVATGAAGNLLTAVACLMGIAAEELRDSEVARCDPDYPVLVTARIHKGPGSKGQEREK